MRQDIGNIVAVTSTGEDKIILFDRDGFEIIEEFRLTTPDGKFSSDNYFGPHGFAMDSNNKYMYTANSYNGSVSVIDLLTGKVIENIYAGTSPCHLDICKRNNFLYVSNYDSDTISGIDLKKNLVAVQIPVNRMPHDIHVSQDGKRVYVSCLGSEEIIIIDTEKNNICGHIHLECCAMHFKTCRRNLNMYACCSKFNCDNQGIVCIIDMIQEKVVKKIKIGMYLTDIALREKAKEIILLDAETNYIYKLNMDNGNMIGNNETGNFPSCIGIDEEKNIAIVGTHIDNTIEIYDLDNLNRLKRIKVGKDLNFISPLIL